MRLLLALLVLAPAAVAQDAPARLAGTVVCAETGDPLPGATVFLPALERGAQTDLDGRFRIDDLSPGTHAVLVSFVGYRRVDAEVTLRPATVRRLAVELELDGDPESECVVVCGESPWTASGVYGARVVRYVSELGCCSDRRRPLYPPATFARDR